MIFIGNHKIVNLLDRSLKSGKIAQAYIFSGPESVGKFTLAKIFAKSMVINNEFRTLLNDTETGAATDNLPDVIILQPEIETKRRIVREKEIGIEKLRDASRFLMTYPLNGRYKILIINDAHMMTESAQNSMLKLMEEPNSTSVVILVTHRERGIISTLRSRCQRILFNLVREEEIKEKIAGLGLDANSNMAESAMGRPGTAVAWQKNPETFPESQKNWGLINELKNSDMNQRLAVSEKMAKNTKEAAGILKGWIWLLRKKSLEENDSARENFKAIEEIELCLGQISRSGSNSRLFLDNLLINIFN